MENMLAEIKDKNSFFQETIREYPDFLKSPENFPRLVYCSLFLFFNANKVFSNFAIRPAEKTFYGCVGIVDLDDNEKVVYKVDVIETGRRIDYQTEVATVKGVKYLHEAIKRILEEHMNRSVEDVYSSLSEHHAKEVENYLRIMGGIPDYLPKAKMDLSALTFFMFCGERDTEVEFDGYRARAEYRHRRFSCKISKGSLIESTIEIDTEKKEVIAGEETAGVAKLRDIIAQKVFAV